jgi:xanthine dehydrogenase accessory factor
MKEIFQEILSILQKKQPCVLCTVVRTKGSTPQKAGAKLLIREEGSSLGTLGGGCVEGDMWYLATQILTEKGKPVFREYQLNEEMAGRGGLVCGGTMYIFIDPIFTQEYFQPFAENIVGALNGEKPLSIATLIKTTGEKLSLGAKLIISEDGSTQGSLGETNLDQEAIAIGKKLAAFGDKQFHQTSDGSQIYVEGFTTPPTLILVGGGHVNKAVSNLANTLGFRIIVVDDRSEFANKDRFPEAEKVIIADYGRGLNELRINSNSYIVVATRGHKYDDVALTSAIRTPARFVGLLGSRRKSILIYKNLLSNNVPLEQIQEVHAPIGLNIGALTPEELAVSIMAEITMVRRGGDGGLMKMGKEYLTKVILNSK